MDDTFERGTEPVSARHAREDRFPRLVGLLVSLAFHALLFLWWGRGISVPAEPGSGAASTRPVAAAGGGALQAMNARLPERREIPPPPRPVAAIDAPLVEVREYATPVSGPDLAPPARTASLPGSGGRAGGDGPGAGAGAGDYSSPMPRSILPHWDPPASVRGMEVTVRVHVDARGRATGEVRLEPPTPDNRFNREIADRVRRMEYRPASRHGTPVDGWAEITFIF